MARVVFYTLFLLFIFLIQKTTGVPNHLLPSFTEVPVDAPSTVGSSNVNRNAGSAGSSNVTKYLRYDTKDPKTSNTLSNSKTISKFKLPYSNDGKDANFFDFNKIPLYNLNHFHNNTKTSESVVSSGYPTEPSTITQSFVFPHSLLMKTSTKNNFSSSRYPSAAESLVNSKKFDNPKLQSKHYNSSLLNTNSSQLSEDTISSADQQSVSRNMRQTTNFFNMPTNNFPKFMNYPTSDKLTTHDSKSKKSTACFTANDSKQDVTVTKKPRFSNLVFEKIFGPQTQSSQFSDRLSQISNNSAIIDSVKSSISETSNFSKQNLNVAPNFTAFPSKITKVPDEILKSSKSASKTVINSQNKLTNEVNPFTKFTNPYSTSSTYQNRNSISRPSNNENFSQTKKISVNSIPESEINSNIQNSYLGPVTRNFLTKSGIKITDLTQEAKPYTVTSPTNTNFLNFNSYKSLYNPTTSKYNNPFYSQTPQNFAPCEKTSISSTVLEDASKIQQYNYEIVTKNMKSDEANVISSDDVPMPIGAQYGININNQNYQPNGPFTRVSVNICPSDKPTSYNYIPTGISLQQPTNTGPISLPITYLSEFSPSPRTIPPISGLPTVVSSPEVISSLLPTVITSSRIHQELQDFIPRANDLSSKIVSSINDVTTSVTNNLFNTAANSLPPLNTCTLPNPSPNLFSAPVFTPIFWPPNYPEITTFTQQPNFPLPLPSINSNSNPYVILTSNYNELSLPYNSFSPVCDINPPSSYESKPIIKTSTSEAKQLSPYIQTVTLNLPYMTEDTSANIILPYLSSTSNDCSSLAPPLTTSNWNGASYPSFIGPPIIKIGSKNKDIKRLLEFMVVAELLNNDKTCNFNAMDNIIALLCLSL